MADILHCDLNNFYASCECLNRPELKNVPVAVCGSQKERHGIVLAKNQIAKEFGVKTGMSNYEALKLCKNLVIFTPDFEKYIHYSNIVRSIYLKYTNFVEPFGIDECWLDVTHSKVFGSPMEIAEKIRKEVFETTGLTISVGVSFNKIFAKIGSDYKKPNAITEITKENFKNIVWNLKIEDMLGVGRKTKEKLNSFGIFKIGELAKVDKQFLLKKFNKWGEYLYNYANGLENTCVCDYYTKRQVKSVGNSTTFYRDLVNEKDVLEGLTMLCEMVSERLIKHKLFYPKTLKVLVKDNKLQYFSKQITLENPTSNSKILIQTAFNLFKSFYTWHLPIRKLGVSVCNFQSENRQLSIFDMIKTKKEKDRENVDLIVGEIRKKYGKLLITRGNYLFDKKLAKLTGYDILELGG